MADLHEALINQFDEAMLGIYQRALSEVHYRASIFFRMLTEHGGLQTAQLLIHSSAVSDGYTALWERKRLDLTVEAMIHDNPKWHPIFTPEELVICKERLTDYQYFS